MRDQAEKIRSLAEGITQAEIEAKHLQPSRSGFFGPSEIISDPSEIESPLKKRISSSEILVGVINDDEEDEAYGAADPALNANRNKFE